MQTDGWTEERRTDSQMDGKRKKDRQTDGRWKEIQIEDVWTQTDGQTVKWTN
jgi:hypothetical protein